jgi:hypothetical protein
LLALTRFKLTGSILSKSSFRVSTNEKRNLTIADQIVVTGPELKELQDDYKKSQAPTTSIGSEATFRSTKPADYIPREPVTFVRPQVPESAQKDPESESDEDEDGIKGVYFENDDGELAEYDE